MKKILIILAFSIATLQTAFAQITITASSGYQAGDSYSIQPCDGNQIELSAEGANITVDYSDVVNNGDVQSQTFVDPSTTPYAAFFPNATVASATVSTQGNTAYGYYEITATKLDVLGVATSQYTMEYTNPSTQIVFPTNYNDSIYDEYEAQYTVNGVLVKRNAILVQKADAYGNITTPQGTFPYLRIAIVQEIVDSMFQSGELIALSYSELYTYNYMNSNFKAPIFTYSEIYTSQGDSYTAGYNISPATALKENTLFTSNENVFPNPAQNEINVEFTMNQNENVSFRIIDINGKVVRTLSPQTFSKGSHQLPLDITALPAGFYSVLIGSENTGVKAIKFAVQ
jgi:hypothetical protein